MKIQDYFEKIFIINLPERQDRLRGMVKELRKIDLTLDSKTLEVFPAIRPQQAKGFSTIGTRGCFLSHLSVLKLAQTQKLERILIMEDDLAFSPFFIENQAKIMDELDKLNMTWDFLYLGYISYPGMDFFEEQKEEEKIRARLNSQLFQLLDRRVNGGHFYGVSYKILAQLIPYLEMLMQRPADHPEGGCCPIDGAYNLFRQHYKDHITLITTQQLSVQRSSRSDINPTALDSTPILRNIVAVLRRFKKPTF